MTARRRNLSTASPWEDVAGFSRAVVVGERVLVAGTAAYGADGRVVGPGDVVVQARRCFEIVCDVVERAGASRRDVIRTRMYVVDRAHCEAVARVHGEFFAAIRPATTLLVVAALASPELLVEVEAEAVVGCGTPEPTGAVRV